MPSAPVSTHRDRLLAALADALEEQGYAGLTVADIVRLARVSKRTFYEHFAGKEDALLALYESNSARIVDAVGVAIQSAPPGEGRVEAGVATYLAALQARPQLVPVTLVEILHAGPRGMAVRRAVNRQFAALLLREMEAAGLPGAPAVAMALVGGVNELVLEAVEEGWADRLTDLLGPVIALLRPFLVSPPGVVPGALGPA